MVAAVPLVSHQLPPGDGDAQEVAPVATATGALQSAATADANDAPKALTPDAGSECDGPPHDVATAPASFSQTIPLEESAATAIATHSAASTTPTPLPSAGGNTEGRTVDSIEGQGSVSPKVAGEASEARPTLTAAVPDASAMPAVLPDAIGEEERPTIGGVATQMPSSSVSSGETSAAMMTAPAAAFAANATPTALPSASGGGERPASPGAGAMAASAFVDSGIEIAATLMAQGPSSSVPSTVSPSAGGDDERPAHTTEALDASSPIAPSATSEPTAMAAVLDANASPTVLQGADVGDDRPAHGAEAAAAYSHVVSGGPSAATAVAASPDGSTAPTALQAVGCEGKRPSADGASPFDSSTLAASFEEPSMATTSSSPSEATRDASSSLATLPRAKGELERSGADGAPSVVPAAVVGAAHNRSAGPTASGESGMGERPTIEASTAFVSSLPTVPHGMSTPTTAQDASLPTATLADAGTGSARRTVEGTTVSAAHSATRLAKVPDVRAAPVALPGARGDNERRTPDDAPASASFSSAASPLSHAKTAAGAALSVDVRSASAAPVALPGPSGGDARPRVDGAIDLRSSSPVASGDVTSVKEGERVAQAGVAAPAPTSVALARDGTAAQALPHKAGGGDRSGGALSATAPKANMPSTSVSVLDEREKLRAQLLEAQRTRGQAQEALQEENSLRPQVARVEAGPARTVSRSPGQVPSWVPLARSPGASDPVEIPASPFELPAANSSSATPMEAIPKSILSCCSSMGSSHSMALPLDDPGLVVSLAAPAQKLSFGPSFDQQNPGIYEEHHYYVIGLLGCSFHVLRPSEDRVHAVIQSAMAPVTIHVYAVGHSKALQRVNTLTKNLLEAGGVFHVGIEVYEQEWSFGFTQANVCGIFCGEPKRCKMHTYRESIYLGDCAKESFEVYDIIQSMRPDWMGPSYDLLEKNCVNFSEALARGLGVGDIPRWLNRLAHVGARLRYAGEVIHGDVRAGVHALHRLEGSVEQEVSEMLERLRNRQRVAGTHRTREATQCVVS